MRNAVQSCIYTPVFIKLCISYFVIFIIATLQCCVHAWTDCVRGSGRHTRHPAGDSARSVLGWIGNPSSLHTSHTADAKRRIFGNCRQHWVSIPVFQYQPLSNLPTLRCSCLIIVIITIILLDFLFVSRSYCCAQYDRLLSSILSVCMWRCTPCRPESVTFREGGGWKLFCRVPNRALPMDFFRHFCRIAYRMYRSATKHSERLKHQQQTSGIKSRL